MRLEPPYSTRSVTPSKHLMSSAGQKAAAPSRIAFVFRLLISRQQEMSVCIQGDARRSAPARLSGASMTTVIEIATNPLAKLPSDGHFRSRIDYGS